MTKGGLAGAHCLKLFKYISTEPSSVLPTQGPAEASMGAPMQPSGKEGNQCLPLQHLLLVCTEMGRSHNPGVFGFGLSSAWPAPSLKAVILANWISLGYWVPTFPQKRLDFPSFITSRRFLPLTLFTFVILWDFFFFKPYSQADPSVFLNNILLLIIPNIDLTSCSWNLTLNSRVTAILS